MQVQKQIEKYNAIVAARGGAPFHTFVLAEYTRSPHDHAAKFSKCERKAAELTTEFLASCRDVAGPDYMRFRKEFKNNEVNVKKHFLRKCLKDAEYCTIEYEDKAYEAKLFRGLKVVTEADQVVGDLFEDLLRAKHRAVGYAGIQDGDDDYSVVTGFWSTHSLSEDPIPGILKTPGLIKQFAY